MKQKFLLLLLILFTCVHAKLKAQTFSVQYDTVSLTYTGTTLEGNNGIVVPSGGANVTLKWRVISTSFPSDWINSQFGFCDNSACYYISSLIPSGMVCLTFDHLAGSTSDFTYYIDLSTATTTGIYYVTLEMVDILAPTSIKTQTYIVKI